MLVPEHSLSEMASSLLCLKFKESLYTVAFSGMRSPGKLGVSGEGTVYQQGLAEHAQRK